MRHQTLWQCKECGKVYMDEEPPADQTCIYCQGIRKKEITWETGYIPIKCILCDQDAKYFVSSKDTSLTRLLDKPVIIPLCEECTKKANALLTEIRKEETHGANQE